MTQRFSLSSAADLAQDWFGLKAEASQLPGYSDENFHLGCADGSQFVLKVSHPQEPYEVLQCQVQVLDYLAGSDLGFLVPKVRPASDGSKLVAVDGPDRQTRWLRVLTFLEGLPMVRLREHPPHLLHELGQTLARLDEILLGFDHPATRRESEWDLSRAAQGVKHLECISDPDRRNLLVHFLGRFQSLVVPRLAGLPRSVIHNDANDHNILVDDPDPGRARLCGLIDFGDLQRTIRIAELAIAAAYVMLDKADPLAAACHLVAGYQKRQPLLASEQEVLYDLIAGRLCTSVIMSNWESRLAPDNEYLLVTARPAWKLLEALSMIEPEQAREKFSDACDAGDQDPEVFSAGSDPEGLAPQRSPAQIMAIRRHQVGLNLATAYAEPLKIVRGKGQHLYDHTGRRYLDLVNNVCHVGHCHPRVVNAVGQQMAVLNTNSRYLHDNLAEYVIRLAETMPDPLRVCFLVNSGTEANDLALRLARAHTGSQEVIVLDHAYHGTSPSMIGISAYKCEAAGGEGLGPHARKVAMPDVFRGPHRGDDAGPAYAEQVRGVIADLRRAGLQPGAFMAESLISCGGQIVLPPGFLEAAYRAVRLAGGVTIADEVQVGFGRVGSHTWGFETQSVVPDIVTLGKPIGNGFPLGAVVTTPEVAASFDNGMEFFNTYGGNPVACAAGLAVLRVISEERLMENARTMGERFLAGLTRLQQEFPIIGDVRGRGLFIGIELVRDPESLAPAAREAVVISEKMKQRGILISVDGALRNVLKIKPPMVLGADDVDETLANLGEVLKQLAGAQPQ